MSVALTVPAVPSIAKLRMIELPADTPAAGTVTASVVPVLCVVLVPMFLTNVGKADDAGAM